MTRTDDDAAERARLERIAWGTGATPAEAARARIALADLTARPRQASGPSHPAPRQERPTSADGVGDGRPAAARTATSPDSIVGAGRPGRATVDGVRWTVRAEDGTTTGVDPSATDCSAGASVPDGSVAERTPDRPVDAHGPDRSLDDADPHGSLDDADPHGSLDDEDPHRSLDDAEQHRAALDDGDGEVDRGHAGAGISTVRAPGVGAPGGRVSSLLAGARGLGDRVRRADRTALWVAAGVAVVVGLAVGTGAGVAVGTGQSARPASATVTPTAGTVTVEQLLAAPQTYTDQLPGAVDAPVMLRSTRLVFTNRSLSGDDASTPWAVWAGTGRDGKMICLVASADRLAGSSACYPREDALHGTVSMTAMSSSGTLWVSLKGGAVLATVTGSY